MDKKLIYEITLKLKDQISASIDKVKKEFRAIDEAAKKAQYTTIQFQSACDKIAKLQFDQTVAPVNRLAQAFGLLNDKGTVFEQSMADLSSATGIVGGNLSDLARAAREIGKESGLGAKNAVDAFALLASQIQVDKMGMEGLKVLQKETITLAQASGMGMADAATALATTINQFKLEADEANRVINVLAAGSKYGKAEIGDLAQSFKATGTTATSAGLSLEETAAALEVLSTSNLKGVEAGTMLRHMLLQMQSELGVDLGETGLSTALEALKPQLNDVAYLTKLFGAENVNAAQFLIANASAVEEMTQLLTGTSVAQEQAGIRTDTVAEKIKRLQASVDEAKIALFNITGALAPYMMILSEVIPAISSFISITQACAQAAAYLQQQQVLAKATILGKMAAEKLATTATGLMTAAQTALNAVMNANPVALVVLAIAALVGGFMTAYKNCEGFCKAVDTAWTAVKEFASAIWNGLIKALKTVEGVLQPVWSKLKALFHIEEDVTESTTATSKGIEGLAETSQNATPGINALNLALGNQAKKLNTNLSTMGGIKNKIQELREEQDEASGEHLIQLEKEIKELEKKLQLLKDTAVLGTYEKVETPILEAPKLTSNPKLDKEGKLIFIPRFDDQQLNKMINWGKAKMRSMFSEKDIFSPMLQGLGGVADIMHSLSGIVSESAGAWLKWGANLMQTIAQAIPKIIALGNTQVAAATAQTTANTAVAASGAAASVASIPIVGWIMAGAAVASIIAMLAAIPKPKAFAAGGIVYGNTFAQIGEYAGAANNPEVIAPLSKLRQLIEPANGGGGVYEFRLRGRDFVAVAAKHNNINNRTR